MIAEDCPVCGQHTLTWTGFNAVECANCGWWPVSIPWDEDDYSDAKKVFDSKPL